LAVQLGQATELTFFVQSPDAKQVAALRKQADEAGLLGTRIYVHEDNYQRLHLAENLVDVILLDDKTAGPGGVPLLELQRVLRPGGKYLHGPIEATKPMPKDGDEWTHPYHAPDNNPQSNDLEARRPFMTPCLAEPWYCPLTQMTVVSGGRMFKAFGDRSSAKPQEDMLNKLIAMSAYNGTILWQRDLTSGFLIHRNTLIATP